MLNIFNIKDDVTAIDFCKQFSNSKPQNRCVFGRNEYAKSIAEVIDVSCFVDDFTEEKEYLGKPIIKTKNIPVDSLVVVAVALGRPLTVEKMLNNLGIKHISYFAFHKYSGLSVLPVTFWDSFEPDFSSHKDKYERVFDLLADDESKRILEKIINFRLSADLKYMDGFTDRQQEQYFEVFLDLDKKGEVFVDVGGFDGFTSLEFMKRCPEYEALYFLEPEKKNMDIAKSRLKKL